MSAVENDPAEPAADDPALGSAEVSESPVATHFARPPGRPLRVAAGIVGLCALTIMIGFGALVLLRAPASMPSEPTTAEHITASESAAIIPLTPAQILELTNRAPDYGPPGSPLNNPQRRASCLSGLGYSASTAVLGAQPVQINARLAVVLVIPADPPDHLVAVAVALSCSAVDTGLLASTVLPNE